MRIGIDLRCLGGGGVDVYARSFLPAVFRAAPHHQFVLFVNGFRSVPHIPMRWTQEYTHVSYVIHRMPNRVLNAVLWYTRRPHLDTLVGGADVFFLPNLNFGAVSRTCKLVTTIHDLSFLYMPECFTSAQRIWHNMINVRDLARRSDAIVAVSRTTAEDVRATLGVSRRKIWTIPSGISLCHDNNPSIDTEEIACRLRLPKKFLLFIGTQEPRKNIPTIIRAFALLRRNPRHQDLHLIIAGGRGWKNFRFIGDDDKHLISPFLHVLTDITEKEKHVLYDRARVFIYPSLYEGFGFPPLEAMAHGVPVVASWGGALHETIGTAGILIDPLRPEDYAHAIDAILCDGILRAELIARGYKRVRDFSWDVAAHVFIKRIENL